jgi:hypothetical protein
MFDDGTAKPVIAAAFSFEEADTAQTVITERRKSATSCSSPERTLRVGGRCYSASQMSLQNSLLSLLLLPPRGE